MPCMLLCTIVTDSISVKILQKVNKYEYEYKFLIFRYIYYICSL